MRLLDAPASEFQEEGPPRLLLARRADAVKVVVRADENLSVGERVRSARHFSQRIARDEIIAIDRLVVPPSALDALCARAMAKSRSDRFPDVREMIRELRNVLKADVTRSR